MLSTFSLNVNLVSQGRHAGPREEEPFTQFRCYFLGSFGKIQAAENVEADEPGKAAEYARAHCREAGYRGFEIWQGPRRLHKEWCEKPERMG